MRRLWLISLSLVACALGAPLPAQTPSAKPLIAVLDLDMAGGTREQALALSNQLRTEILKTGRFTVVDRSQINAILEEQAFQQSGCTGQECAVEVGRILGIRQIVTGGVTRVAENLWQVSTVLIDVETAETLRSETLNYEGPFRDLLFAGMRRMAEQLALAQPAAPAIAAPAAPAAAPPAEPGLGAWRAKWISALTLGVAGLYYGYSEAQATADANDQQKSLLARMDSAASQSEYDALLKKLKSEEDAAQIHQEHSQLGYGAAAVMLGLAAWIYFDPPEPGDASANWLPLLVPERGGLRLAVLARW